jgi:hypothetical protein
VPEPVISVYEKNLFLTYEFVGNIVKDVWRTELMTEEEKSKNRKDIKQRG